MYRLIPLTVIAFIFAGAFLSSCESEIGNNPCDTCGVPCDTCDTTDPCDTCDTTIPCDTCDTTNPNDTTSHEFTWTEYTLNTEASITGVQLWGDNELWVSGKSLYRLSGSEWQEQLIKTTTDRPLNGGGDGVFQDVYFFGFSPNDFWFVRGDIAYNAINKRAKEYRLVTLGVLQFPDDGGLNSCWGTSSSDMFFVGDKGTILHFDGTIFSKFPQVTTKNLYSVWGTSHNDVWASGTNTSTGEITLLHFDGSTWVEDPLALSGDAKKSGLFDVWTYDSSGHSFVATSGSHVFRKTGISVWRSDAGLIPNSLGGGSFVGLYLLKGNNANDLFAAGGWGWVGHWNGKTWKKYDELYDYANLSYFSGALSVKGNTVCVVGSKSGASWIAIGRRKP